MCEEVGNQVSQVNTVNQNCKGRKAAVGNLGPPAPVVTSPLSRRIHVMSDSVSWALQTFPRQLGRVGVVTGANSGIGLEATRGLAALGMRVIMACRDLERGQSALEDVKRSLPGADLEVRQLDLADLESVESFAGTFEDGDRLDVLVNNAGIMAPPRRSETSDGFETQFGVNVLGHFALTARLLPLVLEADAGRVVWLASIAHKQGRIDLEDLNSESAYDPWAAYQQSKLADLMLSFELDRRLADTPAISVAAHPGISATELTEDMMDGSRIKAAIANVVMPILAMPPWKGALPTLVAAVSPDLEGGAYVGPQGFQEMRGMPGPADVAPQARDLEVARDLFAACERLTGLEMPV